MTRATRLDLSDSDFQGLTKEVSDRVYLRQVLHQDEQPGPHARFGWPLVLSVAFILLAYNAPAIVNAVRHYWGV
ncbi:hypothetical protein QTI05_22555 [Variovorax sp. J22R193]|uniref:hypothetical protein n=1 Tax=Variovorax fucosicus TaxID=3053517 RepID=UPI0025789FE8|nr:hypothetical protein [Variovorax sp. J22R193]MDM0041839.1 hypothetical protein [Variovorax sp. J22R193]